MHAVLAFSALPLFAGALLCDWTYSQTTQVQWLNFSSWLIAGGLVLTGLALAWGLVAALSRSARRRRYGLYLLLLLLTFMLGFINALVHAKDAWATMPEGLVMSIIVLIVAVMATALGLAETQQRRRVLVEGARA
jgi:uncharacterized membrane protein